MQGLLSPNPPFELTKTAEDSNYLLLTASLGGISLCDQYLSVSRSGREQNENLSRLTHLRRHTMAQVHDGDVVGVRSLVQTQVVSQAVLQLKNRVKTDVIGSEAQEYKRTRLPTKLIS